MHGVDGAGVRQGEPVPEFPEFRLFGLGENAVGHGVSDSLLPFLLEGLVDGVPVPVGLTGYLGKG